MLSQIALVMKVLRRPFIVVLSLVLLFWAGLTVVVLSAQTPQGLFLVYPPTQHQTTANRIFLIGTAPNNGDVTVNGTAIARSAAGHFAPSFPLKLGNNRFTLRYQQQEIAVTVTRLSTQPETPTGLAFGKDSLAPTVDVAHLPNEWICFAALAPANARVTVRLGNQTISLLSESNRVELPSNLSVLIAQNQPTAITSSHYRGCAHFNQPGDLGKPEYQLTVNGRSLRQFASGKVKILSSANLEVAEVTVTAGVARTGPSTDYSRLTPLPKGTTAAVTGYEGEWVRLDYGGWIKKSEVAIRSTTVPPTSLIRSVKARQVGDWTKIDFPLQVPVPLTVQQTSDTLILTLFNTTAQTDIIRLDDDPIIERLDWQQVQPGQVQYRFQLKTKQQWGYRLRYEGTSLVLGLRHPAGGQGTGNREQGMGEGRQETEDGRQKGGRSKLQGYKILLDPGHGGPEDFGARGPTGYPEKAVALKVAQLLRAELVQRGATVVMTRKADVGVDLGDRVALIEKIQPNLSLSLHYNALPDAGDALNTQGVATFWYHSQAHSLAVFLHNYLVQALNRPSYGVYWNNLALTRPAVTPSILLEMGFMINPDEYEWIVNPNEQQKLAAAIADGIALWLKSTQLT